MRADAIGGDDPLDEVVVARVGGNHRDGDQRALVSRARMRDVAKRHVSPCHSGSLVVDARRDQLPRHERRDNGQNLPRRLRDARRPRPARSCRAPRLRCPRAARHASCRCSPRHGHEPHGEGRPRPPVTAGHGVHADEVEAGAGGVQPGQPEPLRDDVQGQPRARDGAGPRVGDLAFADEAAPAAERDLQGARSRRAARAASFDMVGRDLREAYSG